MGRKIKKVLITTGMISMVILSSILTGCSKKDTVTTESTHVEASFESQEDLNISTQQTSVSKELAEQASKEVEILDELEANGQVVYDEESGDIVSEEQEQLNQDMLNVLRQDVVDGTTTGDAIDEEVDMWCEFLSEAQKEEFKRELHLLDSPKSEVIAEQTKPAPKETKSTSQPKESQPKETQPAPEVTEPAPQPTQPETHYEAGTTVKDANGNEVHKGKLSDNPTYSDEELKGINEIEFN